MKFLLGFVLLVLLLLLLVVVVLGAMDLIGRYFAGASVLGLVMAITVAAFCLDQLENKP